MGDRATVGITQSADNKTVIVYYTHWSGSELLDWVKEAVAIAQPRVHDAPYFTRWVIHELLVREFPSGPQETGAGIWIGDADEVDIMIFVDDKEVHGGGEVLTFEQLKRDLHSL